MKRKTSRLILGMLLTLLGLSLAGPQRGQASMQFCEIERFYSFLAASDTYTSTFRSWYLGDPTTCTTECTNQCNAMQEPQKSQCLANLNTCITNCGNTRFSAHTSAEDAMITAANAPCQFDPDFCEEARNQNTECGLIYAGHMANPVLDENEEIDDTWWSTVWTEYMTCRTASGIDQCE
jgi:hypothetical protein